MTDKRIISLVPSITETLCDLDLQKNIVGCTNFCISPKSLKKTSAVIGGTKDPDIKKIISLNPTHIIMNTEENTENIRKELRKCIELKNVIFYESFPKNIYNSISMVEEIGDIFNKKELAFTWKNQVEQLLQQCNKRNKNALKYTYFIWRNPWMVAGQNTYIANMLSLIGYKNVIHTGKEMNERYPIIEANDTRVLQADTLLFSSEPYPFKQRHIDEFFSLNNQLNSKKILFIDGQLLSWYGTRSRQGLEYLLSDYFN